MKLSKIKLKMLKTCVEKEINSFDMEGIKKWGLLYSQYCLLLSDLKKELDK